MPRVIVDYSQTTGTIKPMHAVNNGPFNVPFEGQPQADYSSYTNFYSYRDARIPYARTHDSSFCYQYGGEHTVDILAVFPNFDADPFLPESYDFTLTDLYLQGIVAAGAKVFYRLGSKIEHWPKKYGTLPPKDFHKWAVICEHIIRHYNEGWADGFHMGIQYWEIWNEPDLDPDDSPNKRTWGGTAQQYYEFYATAATHLKHTFPHLKIGGPAAAVIWQEVWLTGFFERLTRDSTPVPLDFFSWHLYTTSPHELAEKAAIARSWLDRYGYQDTESILDEWNYISDWGKHFIESIQTVTGVRGAAFNAACMCIAQNTDIDMLMYYDAQASIFNGLFDFYTCRPLKGYYAFEMFSHLYALGWQVKCENQVDGIETVSAANACGSTATLISYFTNNETMPVKQFELELRGLTCSLLEYRLLDRMHDAKVVKTIKTDGEAQVLPLKLAPNSIVLIEGLSYTKAG